MYVSMLLLALSGTPAADATEGPVWMTDYVQARKVAASEGKPLAVFVAPGKNGWNKLSNEGKLPGPADRTLTDVYVRCFVDSTTPAGKRLAEALELHSGLGLVISDRTGGLMAFYHEGDLTNTLLAQYLHHYGDPSRVVRTTETNPGHGHHAAAPANGGGCAGGCCGGRCR